MATSPSRIRRALRLLTGAAVREIRAVGSSSARPDEVRAALFEVAPLVVATYAEGSAALAVDWFEEIREEANPPRPFSPRLVVPEPEDLDGIVARTTEPLYDVSRGARDDVETALAKSLADLEGEIQREVAAALRETMTVNADEDPDARGWQRFAQPDGCKFCLMLAANGAVYTKSSVRFAAHTNCSCVVGPSYDANAPQADVIQYVASRRTRTPAQRARVRDYLNQNYPDARG